MKKLLLPAVVIAAITLATCARQEITPEPTPVKFDTFIGKSTGVQTKGTVLTPDILQGLGFYVQAYMTDTEDWKDYTHTSDKAQGDFMAHQHVTWGSEWTYTPDAYWPANNGKVTFFGYAAAIYKQNEGETYKMPLGMSNFKVPQGTNAQASFDFEQDSRVPLGQHIDLVAATPQFDQPKFEDPDPLPVHFDFKHILSKIDFKIVLTDGGNAMAGNPEVVVTSLHIGFVGDKVRSKKTFTFTNDPNETSPGSWSPDAAGDPCFAETPSLMKISNLQANTQLSATQPTDLTASDGYLMLVPQTLPKGALKIKLSYNITTTGNGAPKTVFYYPEISLPKDNLILEQEKQYTFLLKLNLQAVTIDTTTEVKSWEPGKTETEVIE